MHMYEWFSPFNLQGGHSTLQLAQQLVKQEAVIRSPQTKVLFDLIQLRV